MLWSKQALTAIAASAVLLCLPGQPLAVSQIHAPAPSISSSAATASPTPPVVVKPAAPEFFVLIDPSHGGDDKGALLAPRMFEKDLTLSLARALRKELDERGIPARL